MGQRGLKFFTLLVALVSSAGCAENAAARDCGVSARPRILHLGPPPAPVGNGHSTAIEVSVGVLRNGGYLESSRLLKSSGSDSGDRAVMEMVRQTIYQPGSCQGALVPGKLQVVGEAPRSGA